jgi:hypothetical protein
MLIASLRLIRLEPFSGCRFASGLAQVGVTKRDSVCQIKYRSEQLTTLVSDLLNSVINPQPLSSIGIRVPHPPCTS